MRSKGIVFGNPCSKCGKPLRHDYDGLCMDCADELGVSELFEKSKDYKGNLRKASKWLVSNSDERRSK